MEVNPLSIILVISDSKGARLLFRYPYENDTASDILDQKNGKRNPYALNVIEDLLQTQMPQMSNIHKGQLTGFTDKVLATLFAVKNELCNRKFELKVNDVRFVGHPTLLMIANKDGSTSILVHIVFALHALASHSIVKCYHDLSKRLGKALRYEEKRCSFFSEEMKIMIAIHDEVNHNLSETCEPEVLPITSFHHILQKSSLAESLRTVFEEICTTGIIHVRINDWILISFCLPHKAHLCQRGLVIEPETIDNCLRTLKPYHGILLLVDPNELLDSMPLDSSLSLIRLITQYSPLKSLQTLAIETDLPLPQIYQLTCHLVYWAKAKIIFPLCESNVYVIAPDAQVHLHSPLVEKFSKDFPGLCLIQVMSMLSLPAPLWYPARTWVGGAPLLARCIVWMLQRHLLLQLHTYIQFLPTAFGPPRNGTKTYFCERHNGPRHTLSDSLISLNYQPQTIATTPSSENSGDESLALGILNSNDSLNNSQLSLSSNKENILRKDEKFNKINCKSAFIDKNKHDQKLIHNITFNENTVDLSNEMIQFNLDKNEIFDKKIIKAGNVESDNINNGNINFNCDGKHNLNESDSSLLNLNKLSILNNNMKSPQLNRQNSFDDGEDGLVKQNSNEKCDTSDLIIKPLNGFNSLKIGDNSINSKPHLNGFQEKDKSHLILNISNSSSSSNVSEKKYNSTYKYLETNFQPPTVISTLNHQNSCDVIDTSYKNSNTSLYNSNEPINKETLLAEFTEDEKAALFKIPAAHNPEDLALMTTLYKKGYFRGEQHLENIMFTENLTRSQLLQLLDKFRDVLVTYETEDSAIAMLYSNA